jgi:condensin complex subunit 3
MLPSNEVDDGSKRLICKLMKRLHPVEDDYLNRMLEIISDIQDPLEVQENSQAPKPPETKDEAKQRWMKVLLITEEMLQNLRVGIASPEMSGLKDTIILPAIQQQSVEVRNAAVKCLGLFCLLDKETAQHNILLLLEILKNDRTAIQLTCMKVIFDLLMVFGIQPFQEQDLDSVLSQQPSQSAPNPLDSQESDFERKSNEYSVVVFALKRFMTNINIELRACATEGLAKLFLADLVRLIKFINQS